jgi:ribosomal protein L23
MKIVLLFLSLALLSAHASAVRINEIMYNPAGEDYDFEFIELYSNESTDVSNYYFEGIDFVFPENSTIADHVIIANTCNDTGPDNDFADRYNVSCEFEYGGTLSNSGETISLLSPEGNTVVLVNYSDIAPENYSLELTSNGWLVSEIEGGTPGNENSHPFLLESSNTTNATTNSTINATNMTNLTANQTIVIDPSLTIATEKTNFANGEQIKFRHIIENKTQQYEIEYWIEDLFGEIIKSKKITENTNEKSYTPSIKEKDKILVIKSILYVECNDTNLSNNYAEKIVFVVNPDYEQQEQKQEDEQSSESMAKKETKTEKSQITSFYTLAKKFELNKSVKFFSYVHNPGPGSEFILFFIHNSQLIETQNLNLENDETKQASFESALEKGNNTFKLDLYQDNRLIDSKELSLHVNFTEITADNTSKEKFINTTRLQFDTEKDGEPVQLQNKNSIAYYILLGLSVVFNAVLVWRR